MPRTTEKSITKLRSSLFEIFEEVVAGKMQIITHKNGIKIAMITLEKVEAMEDEIELHKNLAHGYAESLRGQTLSTKEVLKQLKKDRTSLRKKHG